MESAWICPFCTFVNPALFLRCEMCETERNQTSAQEVATSAPAPSAQSAPSEVVLVGGGPSAASFATATAVAMPAGPGPTSQPVAASSGAASAGAPPGSRVSHLSGSRFGERMGRLLGSST